MKTKITYVTASTVNEYLARRRHPYRTYENKMNGKKGVYDPSVGPASSFVIKGKTWREVLLTLAIESDDRPMIRQLTIE